jgi:hypothetical protein
LGSAERAEGYREKGGLRLRRLWVEGRELERRSVVEMELERSVGDGLGRGEVVVCGVEVKDSGRAAGVTGGRVK